MELDPGGSSKPQYGVGIGQHVLICDDNGMPLPEVPILGRFPTPLDDMVLRETMAAMADDYARTSTQIPEVLPRGDRSKIDWFGEVIRLHLDGTFDVRLANGTLSRVSLKQVNILGESGGVDGMEPMDGQDIWMDEMNGDEEMMSDASWETMSGRSDQDTEPRESESLHESNVDDDDDPMDGTEDEMDMDEEEMDRRAVDASMPMIPPSSPVHRADDLSAAYKQSEAGPSTPRRPSPALPTGAASRSTSLEDDERWQRFEMLEEAPEDHHFFKELSNQAGSRAYHNRLQKEHRALASSLPGELCPSTRDSGLKLADNILVRTYENRTDLLRCLIIGPEGTP
jgi:ubiquitin-conjugating enzyme E2 O